MNESKWIKISTAHQESVVNVKLVFVPRYTVWIMSLYNLCIVSDHQQIANFWQYEAGWNTKQN